MLLIIVDRTNIKVFIAGRQSLNLQIIFKHKPNSIRRHQTEHDIREWIDQIE